MHMYTHSTFLFYSMLDYTYYMLMFILMLYAPSNQIRVQFKNLFWNITMKKIFKGVTIIILVKYQITAAKHFGNCRRS